MKESKKSDPTETAIAKAPADARDGPLESIVKCPVELNETARGLWDRLVKFLVPTNMLKPVDEVTLAIFCQAWAGWLEANQALEKFGQVMNSPSGYPQQSPFVSIAKNHAETMIKIAKEFGFTPHSRGRTWMVAAEPDAGLLELDVSDLAKF